MIANWLKKVFSKAETRDMNLQDPDGWRDITGPPTAAGVSMTPNAALGIPAALRAVTLLSGAVASLPLKVYRRTPDGRETAADTAFYNALHAAPNPATSPFVLKELIMNGLLLNGNFYALMDHGQLWPIEPSSVVIEQNDNGQISYRVTARNGIEILHPENVLHIRGLTLDGVRGVSPIALARESLGGAYAELRHGQTMFKNGANLGGVLQHPGHLGSDAAEILRKSWREKYSGVDNAGKVAILEEGMEFKPIALSNKDSQWLESRQASVLDISRIFGVPPALLGHLEKASYSSQEAQNLEFLTHSLRPWLTRIEQAINQQYLPAGGSLFCEFIAGDLLRTTTTERFNAYRIALTNGLMSINEVRSMENLPKVTGGDVHYIPLNMGKIGGHSHE